MSFIIYKEQVVELLKDARSMLRIPSYKVETALWVACIYIYMECNITSNLFISSLMVW